VLSREGVEGQQLGLGVLQQPGHLGACHRSWSTTWASRSRASAAVVAVKIPRMAPDTSGCWVRATWNDLLLSLGLELRVVR
jgi:hypothetical protein